MKKRGCFWIGMIFFFLLLFVVMVNIPYKKFGGDRIVIAEDTTVLTEPVRPDGGIDYLAAINQRQSEGVTFENNAIVLLFRLTPIDRFGGVDKKVVGSARDQFAKALGYEKTPDVIELLDPYDLLREEFYATNDDPLDRQDFDSRLGIERLEVTRPWSSEKFPKWASKMKEQNAALDLIVEAASRERYYLPQIADVQVAHHPMMVNVLLPVAQRVETCANILQFRAMNALGDGDIEAALRDTRAIRRLGWLQCQSDLLIEKLIANAVFRMASECEQHLLGSRLITEQQIADYRQFLKEHSYVRDMARRIDQSERMMVLDQMQNMQLYPDEVFRSGFFFKAATNTEAHQTMLPIVIKSADMAEAMRVTNGWFDRFVEAASQPTMKESLHAVRQMEEELVQMEVDIGNLRKTGWRMIQGSRSRGKVVGEVAAAMWLPSALHVLNVEFEQAIQHQVNQMAFAVADWEKKHGRLPENLNELVPEFFDALPIDPLNECPFEYHHQDQGFYIYSKGVDGKDDKGRGSHETALRGLNHDVRFSAGLIPEYANGSWADQQNANQEAEKKQLKETRQQRERERKAQQKLDQEKKNEKPGEPDRS